MTTFHPFVTELTILLNSFTPQNSVLRLSLTHSDHATLRSVMC